MRAFRFRLARDLGRTVHELGTMAAAEFAEWVAFYLLESDELSGEKEIDPRIIAQQFGGDDG